MDRSAAFALAEARSLDRSAIGRGFVATTEPHASMLSRTALIHDVIAEHRMQRAAVGAEGIAVSEDEFRADLDATNREVLGLVADFTVAASTGRLPMVLATQWNHFVAGWNEFRAAALARLETEQQRQADLLSWIVTYIAPVQVMPLRATMRAQFLAEVQALNTRLEGYKDAVRQWASRYEGATGTPPTAPIRARQAPPSEQVVPLVPAIVAASGALSTGIIVAGVGAAFVLLFAMAHK